MKIAALILSFGVSLSAHASCKDAAKGALIPKDETSDLTLETDGQSKALTVGGVAAEQLIKDLVVNGNILFSPNMYYDFETAYKYLIYGSEDGSAYSDTSHYSIRAARENFITFSSEQKYRIAEEVWKRTRTRWGVDGKASDALFVKIAEKEKTTAEQARLNYKIIGTYSEDRNLREQAYRFLEIGLPDFLSVAPHYLPLFKKQTNSTTLAYPDTRIRDWTTVTLSTLSVGGPAFASLFVIHDWMPLLSIPAFLGASLGTQFAIFKMQLASIKSRFGRSLRKNSVDGLTLIRSDSNLNLLEDLTREAPKAAESTLSTIEAESKELPNQIADPKSQKYAESKFADFGASAVGARNFLISMKLYQVNELLDRQMFFVGLAKQIRGNIEAGKIDELTRPAFLRRAQDAIEQRTDFISAIRRDLGRIEDYIATTESGIAKYIKYAETEAVKEMAAKSTTIEKNLAIQVAALQAQKATSVVLSQTLAKVEHRTSIEATNLLRASNALVLINLNPSGKDNEMKDWLELVDALEAH